MVGLSGSFIFHAVVKSNNSTLPTKHHQWLPMTERINSKLLSIQALSQPGPSLPLFIYCHYLSLIRLPVIAKWCKPHAISRSNYIFAQAIPSVRRILPKFPHMESLYYVSDFSKKYSSPKAHLLQPAFFTMFHIPLTPIWFTSLPANQFFQLNWSVLKTGTYTSDNSRV